MRGIINYHQISGYHIVDIVGCNVGYGYNIGDNTVIIPKQSWINSIDKVGWINIQDSG